jgi:hypothetical protein
LLITLARHEAHIERLHLPFLRGDLASHVTSTDAPEGKSYKKHTDRIARRSIILLHLKRGQRLTQTHPLLL